MHNGSRGVDATSRRPYRRIVAPECSALSYCLIETVDGGVPNGGEDRATYRAAAMRRIEARRAMKVESCLALALL